MRIRSTPGYSELFGGSANLEELLKGIPSITVIKVVSWLNAQFLSTATPLDRDQELRAELTRSLTKDEVGQLGLRLWNCSGPRTQVFHSIYLTYLLHYELTHFRDLPDRDLEASEELRIFKAYLVVIDLYNELASIPDVDVALSDEEYFTQRIWPMLFKQHEFNRDVDPIFTTTRLYLLMDTLGKSRYSKFVTSYCSRFGCTDGFHLVRIFLSVISVSNNSNDGKNRVHRIEATAQETRPLLDSLSHRVATEIEPWKPLSLITLKQFPLYKAKEGEYHILNWNFFYRSVYDAMLRDFYNTSGISEVLRSYGDFKNWVSLEVTEKRLFRAILDTIYQGRSERVVFPDETTSEKPDAYVQHRRYVVVLECKDTDVSEENQSTFDYVSFKKELNKKHVKSEKDQPKSICQLARNAAEIMTGLFPQDLYTNHRAKDLWVLPVLVCDGYLHTAPGLNELLNKQYEVVRQKKTGRLTVLTLEYLFRKIADLQETGLAAPLLSYSSDCGKRRKRFQESPTAEAALETYPSIEEVIGIDRLSYKSHRSFISEFYERLGLPMGVRNDQVDEAGA
jgi:hypothetical protein